MRGNPAMRSLSRCARGCDAPSTRRKTSVALWSAVVAALLASGCLTPGDAPGSGECAWQDRAVSGPTGDGFAQHEPAIAADESGHVYVLWMIEDLTAKTAGTGTLGFAASDDNGESFTVCGAPRASEDHNWTADPSLAVDSLGRLHASWLEGRVATADFVNHVYYASSDDHGRSFTRPVQIDTLAPSFGVDRDWMALGGDGSIYIVWSGGVTGLSDLFVARSADRGASWTVASAASLPPEHWAVAPAIATARPARVVLGYTNADQRTGSCHYEIIMSDDGHTFGRPRVVEPLENPSAWDTYAYPLVALDATGAVLVCCSTGAKQIAMMRSAAGDGFTTSIVSPEQTEAGLYGSLPAMRVGGDGVLHLGWLAADADSRWSAYYACSTDHGASFTVPACISDGTFTYPLVDFDTFHRLGDFNGIAVTSARVFYAFADRRSGKFEVRVSSRPLHSGSTR